MSQRPEFETVESVCNDDVFQETLTESGTFYYRYVCKNANGSCEAMGETYTVSIGESSLICPNAFSPTATPGVNDEWRVQYKSIVKFKCWIFNRWGVQLCELTDPSQGWDGKYKGKNVGTGVYYYVIQAEGSDGKEYKLKGDINIINYNESNGSVDNSGEGVVE
jgi:gliding motility-associated-like protein